MIATIRKLGGIGALIVSFPNAVIREGGLLIVVDGKIVGGIGVSGGKPSEDAQVAQAGVDALTK